MNVNDKLSILLVEDNDLNQKLMQLTLARFNYTVTIASNGIEGFEKFKSQKFDLILMDIMMPIMDGFESTKLIRAYENKNTIVPHIPIIAFTANTINIDRQMCMNSGMDDIIDKPFDIIKFKEIITRLSNG